jgi:hypothetical protein
VLLWPLLALTLTIQQPATAEEPSVQITLKATTCFGECPDYTVSIDGSGSVTYEGRQFVRVAGKQTARIDRTAVQALLEEFQRIGFFSLKDNYHPGNVFDLPTTYVTVTLGDRSKTVDDYFGAPKSLHDLERHIQEAAGVQRWIRIDAATVRHMARTGWRASGDEGNELLRKALLHDETEVVAALLEAGADANAEPTPLTLARIRPAAARGRSERACAQRRRHHATVDVHLQGSGTHESAASCRRRRGRPITRSAALSRGLRRQCGCCGSAAEGRRRCREI